MGNPYKNTKKTEKWQKAAKMWKNRGADKGERAQKRKKHRVYISAKKTQKASNSEVKLQRTGLKKEWVTRPNDGEGERRMKLEFIIWIYTNNYQYQFRKIQKDQTKIDKRQPSKTADRPKGTDFTRKTGAASAQEKLRSPKTN